VISLRLFHFLSNNLELRKQLYFLFSQFGPILDVVAQKTPKMRGQAFIVFRDIITATNAMRDMQDFVFFDKPMSIHYAKTTSDIVAKMEGTYQSKERRAQEAADTEESRKRKSVPGSAEDEPPSKRQDTRRPKKQSQQFDELALRQIPPNKTLFIQNLPPECTDNMLVTLFQKYPGFLEVRLPPGQKGVAFVDFTNEMQSAVAMGQLQGFRITHDHPMMISFQKSRME